MTQIGIVIVATFLFSSVIFHLIYKPKIWKPIFWNMLVGLIIGIMITIANPPDRVDYIFAFPIAISIIFLVPAFFVAILFRYFIFYREYEEALQIEQSTKFSITRAKISGAISLIFGTTILAILFFSESGKDELEPQAILGGVMFFVYGIYLLFSDTAGGSLSQWIFKGKLSIDSDTKKNKL